MYIMSLSPKGKPYRKRNPRNRRNKRSLRRRWVNLRIGSLKNRRGGARRPARLRRATKRQPAKRQPAKGRSAKKQKTRKRTSFAITNRTKKRLSGADSEAVLYKGREAGSIRRDADTIFKRILSSVAKGGALAKILVPTYPKKILQHIVDDDKITDKGAAFREVLRGTSLNTYATWERRALQNVRKGSIKNKLKSIFVQLRRYTRFQATSPEERAAARSPKTKGKPALANIHEDHFSAPVAAPAAVKKQSATLSRTPAALRAAQPIRPAFDAQGKSAVSATPSVKQPSLRQRLTRLFTRRKRKGSKTRNGTRKRALVKPVKPAAEIEQRPFKKSSAAPAAAPQDVAANARAIAGVSGLTDDKLAQNIRSTEKSIQTLRNKKKSDLNDRERLQLARVERRLRVLRQESNKRNPAPPAAPAAPAAPAPPAAPAAPAPPPAPAAPAPPAPPAVVAPGAPGSPGVTASSSKRDRDPIKWGETDVTASPTKKKMTIRIGVDNGVVFFDTNARQAGNTATETVKSVKKVLRGGRKKRTRKKKRTKRRRKRV